MTNKGISLITLVITIIVIIILTGAIVLSMSGNNPLLKTSEAVFKNDISEIQQGVQNAYTNYVAANVGAEPSDIPFDIPSKYASEIIKIEGGVAYIGTDKTKMQWAASQGVPVIPSGFVYVGGSVDNGMVISDNSGDLNKGDSHAVVQTLTGNQFVWVPVNKIEGGYANRALVTDLDGITETSFADGTLTEDSTYAADYTAIETSITKYGGFYIARYEASFPVSGSSLTQGVKARSIAGSATGYLMSYSDATTGAVVKAKTMYNGNTYVQSTLTTGKQWDTVMQWMRYVENPNVTGKYYIEDSTGMGNYSYDSENNLVGSSWKVNTGSNSIYAVKNIYDMAGNVAEWVMEKDNRGYASLRGGFFYNDQTYPIYALAHINTNWTAASHRMYWSTNSYSFSNVGGSLSCRIAMYIK